MTSAYLYLHDTARDAYLSPRRVQSQSDFRYTSEQLDGLKSSFPSLDLAMRIDHNCCLLIPTPPEPMNLLDLKAMFPEYFYTKNAAWYSSPFQAFARNEYMPAAKWLAVCRAAYESSRKLVWSEQLDRLPSGMYVPRAVELVYTMAIYAKLRDRHILNDRFNRTSSSTPDYEQVVVGPFGKPGIVISHEKNSVQRSNLLNAVGLMLELPR